MDRDVSTDQGSFPIHGIRDVGLKADTEQHDWSELAAITDVNTLSADPKSYSTATIHALTVKRLLTHVVCKFEERAFAKQPITLAGVEGFRGFDQRCLEVSFVQRQTGIVLGFGHFIQLIQFHCNTQPNSPLHSTLSEASKSSN